MRPMRPKGRGGECARRYRYTNDLIVQSKISLELFIVFKQLARGSQKRFDDERSINHGTVIFIRYSGFRIDF